MKVPKTGELKSTIIIRQRKDVPDDQFGLIQKYKEAIKVRSKVEHVRSLKISEGTQTDEMLTHLFWIRKAPGRTAEEVSSFHSIAWNGRRYRVAGTASFGKTLEFVRISALDIGEIGE